MAPGKASTRAKGKPGGKPGAQAKAGAEPEAPAGGAAAGSERTRRLVNLIALLLDAREGLSFEEIREALPGAYDGGYDAAIRRFERDKEDLLELGLPLVHPTPDGDEDLGRYLVDRRAAFLPEIHFTPEEASVLLLAGSALLAQDEFPYRRHLEMAIAKLRLGESAASAAAAHEPGAGDVVIRHGLVAGGPETRKALDLLGGAVARRKRVTFTYHAQTTGAVEKRAVDPYGLYCRRGAWLLVGHAHERDAVRSFFVHRMSRITVSGARPKSPDFEIPPGLDLREHADLPRWRWNVHDSMDVAVEVDPALAPLAARELGLVSFASAGAATGAGGWPRFRVVVTNLDGIVEWVLALGPRARIVAPPEVRVRVRAVLETTLARHETARRPEAG